MTLKSTLAALAVLFLAAACNPIYVNTDYDREADFDMYHTFGWIDLPDSVDTGRNPLLEKRVRGWLREELEAKGMTYTEAGPDVFVNFIGDAREAVDIRTTGSGYGFDRYTRAQRYEDGTILVDLIDATDRQLVWRGTADLTLSENPDTDEVNKRVRSAIREIFKEYPPPKK